MSRRELGRLTRLLAEAIALEACQLWNQRLARTGERVRTIVRLPTHTSLVGTCLEAGYTREQILLAVFIASRGADPYYRNLDGNTGFSTALSLGGRPRVRNGHVVGSTVNHLARLLDGPSVTYGPRGDALLKQYGLEAEAAAREWERE